VVPQTRYGSFGSVLREWRRHLIESTKEPNLLDEVLVTPPEEIDPGCAEAFGEALAAAAPDDSLVVDFADVAFCDSSGIRELILAYLRQQEGGGSVRLINVSDRMRRVFDVAGVTERFLPREPA
jgi:anti-anti-sigma factor